MPEKKSNKDLFFHWIRYITPLFALVIFTYVLTAHILKLIVPNETFIDQHVFESDYLRILIFLGLLLDFVGWIIAYFLKQIKFVSPLSYSLNAKFPLVLSAFFLTVFFHESFSFWSLINYLSFFGLLLFFIFAIPQLEQTFFSIRIQEIKNLLSQSFSKDKFKFPFTDKKEFISHLRGKIELFKTVRAIFLYPKLKPAVSDEQNKPGADNIYEREYFRLLKILKIIIKFLFGIFIIVLLLFAFFFTVGIINRYMEGEISQDNFKKTRFTIMRVIPDKPLHAQKVKIEGFNFGWRSDPQKRYRIMTTDGPIRLIEVWTNEMIEITIPLEFPTGKTKLWLERPGEGSQKNQTVKSNQVSLKIFSRFSLYPSENDSLIIRAFKKIKRYIYFKFPYLTDFILI